MPDKNEIKQKIAELQAQLILIESKEPRRKKVSERNEKHVCEICGGKYTWQNKSTHIKTKKHIREVQHIDTIRRVARAKTLDGRAG
jgi:Tfp pilus assembly major pilin PilA